MVIRSIVLVLALLWSTAPVARAHVLENMGLADPLEPLPPVRDADPIADQEIQRMAIDMKSADCEALSALEEDVREAFFITQLFLQRSGSLSRIVGPTCRFLGPATKIAEVSDPALVLGNTRESMYFLEDMHAIIVTHEDRDTIAYGMFYHGEDPVSYFLENRDDAERSAAVAKLFLESTIDLEPQTGQRPSSRSPIIELSSSSSAESTATESSGVAQADSSRPTQPPATGSSRSALSFDATAPETSSSATADTEGSTSSAIEASSSAIPDIAPIGPEPPPPEEQNSLMLWFALGAFVLLVIALVVGYNMLKKYANRVPDGNEEES